VLFYVAMDAATYDIIGAALEVHCSLGPGFLEAVYQEALSVELSERGIPFADQAEVPVIYKGKRLKTCYRADFVCQDSIIVELKAISKLGDNETAQVLNYLRNRVPKRASIQFRRQEPRTAQARDGTQSSPTKPKFLICGICEICG
jgi:GxxExxY protein